MPGNTRQTKETYFSWLRYEIGYFLTENSSFSDYVLAALLWVLSFLTPMDALSFIAWLVVLIVILYNELLRENSERHFWVLLQAIPVSHLILREFTEFPPFVFWGILLGLTVHFLTKTLFDYWRY